MFNKYIKIALEVTISLISLMLHFNTFILHQHIKEWNKLDSWFMVSDSRYFPSLLIITITHCNMFKINYALSISVCHLSNQVCLFLKMTKRSPQYLLWFNLGISHDVWMVDLLWVYKCTFLIDSHLHWTHCY